MSNVIKNYPIFEGSQVLTSSQLNQMAAYLDQQGRLTRSKLIGIGIVCGLEVSFRSNNILISKGIGISSEGFLMSLGESRCTHYREYQLPEGVNYRPFGYPDQDVTLYELLQQVPEDDTGVNPLTPPLNFLRDKFVLLFLEIFDQDLKSCLGNSCDDRGKDRIFTIRKLMVSKEDLDLILERSSNVPVAYPSKSNLTKLNIPRVLFDPSNPHSQNYRDFSNHYKNRIYPDFFREVLGALEQSYVALEGLLSISYNFRNPITADLITNLRNSWVSYLEEDGSDLDQLKGIQYFYGFLKDLALAYEEFRQHAMEIEGICCADSSLFPKHLMLGKAIPFEATPEETTNYRHGFVQPPVFNLQKSLTEKVISLHHRLVMMVEKFDLNQFVNREETDYPIKIVPSLEKSESFSKRSIPYYYNIKERSELVLHGHLEKHWDYDFWKNEGRPQNIDIPGYNNQAENSDTQRSELETPLYYDIDRYGFFRIEGHLGKPRNQVLDQINQLRNRFNLSFRVKTLHLDDSYTGPEMELGCGFNDLQEEYRVQRSIVVATIEDLAEIYRFLEEMEVIERDVEADFDLLERLREILELIREISNRLPDCLEDLDFESFQDAYKESLQAIIDLILIDARLLDSINVDAESAERELPIINGMLHRLSPILFRFLDLWFFTKFLRLHYSYHRRLYYQRRASLFSAYLQQNPGMEHLAGVPKSGTFVVVFEGDNQQVIGDFALPYQCCGNEGCTPPCNEEEETGYRPSPFARPDYAITLMNIAIEIGVHLNDRGLFGNDWQFSGDGSSAEGGSIEQIDSGFRYQPPSDFSGVDFFFYSITDRVSGDSDRGKVTILVKDPRRRTGCYSIEILTTWGIGFVNGALEHRGVSPDRFNSDEERIEHLLGLLVETRGFTEDEVFGSILEDPSARVSLLRAIGIDPSNLDYEQMGEEIFRYQRDNCGTSSEPRCRVTRVTGQILDPDGQGLPGASILVRDSDRGTASDTDGRFTIDLGSPGQTLLVSFVGFTTQEIEICNQENIEVIMESVSQPDLRCYTADMLRNWGENNIIRALENTPYRVSPENFRREGFYEAFEEALAGTGGFPRTVLQLGIESSPDPWLILLEIVGVSLDSTDSGAILEAFLGYQNQNCGPASDPFVTNCYPVEILQCWGLENIRAAIPDLRFLNDNPEDLNNFLLLTAAFSRLGGIPSSVLETITPNNQSLWLPLTTCIGARLSPNANPQAIRQAILAYQAENCGDNARIGNLIVVPGSRITETERSRIEEDRIARGDINLDLGNFTLENPSAGRVALSERELGLLTNNTLREIASDLNRTVRSSDNKDTLINNILNRG